MSFHRNHWLLFATIFFGFIFLASFIAIGPAYWVQAEVDVQRAPKPLTSLQQHGLDVYISEGCVACHTQQVRPIAMDHVWGRPSAPRDYANLGPMGVWRPYTKGLLGSARIGPDLSDVGSRQPSEIWQYMHLYNPRSVVSESIMPAYPWLFAVVANPAENAAVIPVPKRYAPGTGKVVPNERGRALVAYLVSLKQEIGQANASSKPPARQPTKENKQPEPQEAKMDVNGATLYSNNCASCHQVNGEGLAGVFPPLAGDAIVTAEDPSEHIGTVLNGAHGRTINGQTYSAPMPGFANRFTDAEVSAIVNHERTSWGNNAPTVTAADVAKQRATGK